MSSSFQGCQLKKISESEEKIVASKKSATQQHEHSARAKVEAAVEKPRAESREHDYLIRSKPSASRGNLNSLVLSMNSGKLEDHRHLHIGKDKNM